MKKILLVLFLNLLLINTYGQNFEGKIIYKNTYKSKSPKLSDEQLSSMMGDKQEYLIKNGNYKSSTNGTFVQWQIYNNKENRLYTKMSNSETIYWNDGNVNNDSLIDAKLEKKVITILGYECDELTLNCKSGIHKYYYNSKLSIDPKLFENHKYGNWYEFVSRSKAVPLKIVVDVRQFSFESTATSVESQKIDEKEFQLPENAVTAKSPN